MKKILSMLLTVLFIVTVFVGCSNTDKPTDATETTSTVMDDIPVEMADGITPEEVTTDEEGNEVLVGKDADGNTVEIKKDKDGTVTKTVTDKETGKKTEQTTTVAPKPATTTSKSQQTTKKPETTTKKSTPQTTKKPETTTKKPAQNTTTKPATTKPASQTPTKPAQTTTTKPVHVHKFVTKTETVQETVTKQEEHHFCMTCGLDESEAYDRGDIPGCTSVAMFHMKHVKQAHPNTTGNSRGGKIVTVTEKVAITYAWEECSCGATQNRHKV